MKPSQAFRLVTVFMAGFAFWVAGYGFTHAHDGTELFAGLFVFAGLCALVAVCTPSAWKGMD